MKSSTDNCEPNLVIPYAERLEPDLIKDLKLIDEASVTKLSTLSDEPSLANARSETQLPIWMKSRKLIEDPSLDIP